MMPEIHDGFTCHAVGGIQGLDTFQARQQRRIVLRHGRVVLRQRGVVQAGHPGAVQVAVRQHALQVHLA